jgi:hypothetical protein
METLLTPATAATDTSSRTTYYARQGKSVSATDFELIMLLGEGVLVYRRALAYAPGDVLLSETITTDVFDCRRMVEGQWYGDCRWVKMYPADGIALAERYQALAQEVKQRVGAR